MINYTIPGLKKLREAVGMTPGQIATRDELAVDASLELVKGSLAGQIRSGPGHFGYHARDRMFIRVASVQRITGTLYATAPQLRWSEVGTRPHLINRWLDAGRTGSVQFTIHHPGERATHLFRSTLTAAKPAIQSIFVGATARVVNDLARRAQ